jgi:hypothetical protein
MATAWIELPAAMTAEASSAPSIVRLAKKLPASTAGHRRRPPRSNAATAIPEGGQTAVA